jgi:shikimate dehydrogenase
MTSQPYAEVIGDPVGHSKSPLIHGFWLDKLELDGAYRALRVTTAELGGYFEVRARDPDWRGCNITMPHKLAALAYVHKHQDPSFPPEPINLAAPLRGRIEGVNTDTTGMLEPLLALGGQLSEAQSGAPRTAVVLGAGGVFFSAAQVLMALGYSPIIAVVRDRARIDAFLAKADRRQFAVARWGDPLPACDLLVNATPLGMSGQAALPYDASSVREGGIVFDMIYQPVETALLADARRRGLRTVDGLQMLVGQAAPSFQLFFGQPAPRQFDGELRERLVA